MGRDETPSDDPALHQMFFGFRQGNSQDIVGMLRVLSGSPSFTQRTGAP
jgi:hypothetical protein